MLWKQKLADVTPGSTVSPLPQTEVSTTKAPKTQGAMEAGLRTNYSRVNTGTPPQPEAGSSTQKSMPPMGAATLPAKIASEDRMGKMMSAPTLQEMVKSAMAGAQSRAALAAEATRQQFNLGEKVAEEKCSECGMDMHEGSCSKKKTSSANSVDTEYAIKLADAMEYASSLIKKEATLGEGAGALQVLEATHSTPIPENTGKAHHQQPMTPGTQEGTQMENNLHKAPGSGVMVQKNVGKVASILSKLAKEDEKLEKKETEGMATAKKGLEKAEAAHEKENSGGEKKEASNSLVDYMLGITKKAEDAINPAHISAGAAVPPETSEAGQVNGAPSGGKPQGPTGLIGSNESSINYNKSEAKSPVKSDLAKYLTEPALSGSTDSTLHAALEHSSAKDGNKFASAGVTKVAAARALLSKLAEAAQERVR